jgi:hypothetical protein
MSEVNSDQSRAAKAWHRVTFPLIAISLGAWGVGQLFPFSWWYLHGVTIGDILFIGWLLFGVVAVPQFGLRIVQTALRFRWYSGAACMMIAILLVSTCIGHAWTDLSPYFVVSILRSGYFLIISLSIIVLSGAFGVAPLVAAYLIGLSAAAVVVFLFSQQPPVVTACEWPVLFNSNVVGNMLGIGIIMSSLLILARRFIYFALCSTFLFVGISIFSFSKGAWIMVLLGICIIPIAFIFANRVRPQGAVKMPARRHIALFIIGLACLAAVLGREATCQLAWKVRAQAANGSLQTREQMIVDVLQAVFPASAPSGMPSVRLFITGLVGHGVGNDARVLPQYDGPGGEIGYSSQANPHNVFAYILLVGGAAALVAFAVALVSPLAKAWLLFGRCAPASLYIGLAGLAFLTSGSFQLQLYSQPYFWLYAGFLLAIASRKESGQVGLAGT